MLRRAHHDGSSQFLPDWATASRKTHGIPAGAGPTGRYLGSPWDLGPHICCSCKGSSWHGLEFTIFSPPWAASIHPQKSVQLGQVMSAITLMLHSFLMRFNPSASDVCLNSQGIRTGIRCIVRQDFGSVHVQSHPRQLYALTSPNHGISMGCGTAVLQLHGLGDLKL